MNKQTESRESRSDRARRDGIYRKKASKQELKVVYFNYYKIDRRGIVETKRSYIARNRRADGIDRNQLRQLIMNARTGDDEPQAYGESIADIYMRKKGYVVFAIDGPELDEEIPIEISNANDAAESEHTFSDAECMSIYVGPGDNVDVAVVANRILGRSGQDDDHLGNTTEKFLFKLNPRDPSLRGKDLEPESGGTNMGPPVGPP